MNKYMTPKQFSVNNQNILITGASRGLGFHIAKAFTDNGSNVLGIGKSKIINSTNYNFYIEQANVNELQKIDNLINSYFKNEPLDTLINVAGITEEGHLKRNIINNIEVNLSDTINLSIFCKKFMLKGGSIINFASLASYKGFPNNPGYAAAKGGIISATRALAYDFAEFNIRVNAIVPGYFKTDMTKKSWFNLKKRNKISAHSMLKRWGKIEEIIGPTIFLSSNASSFITGEKIIVDGGWLAKGLI